MANGFMSRIKHGWNAFMNKDPTPDIRYRNYGPGYSRRIDRPRFTRGNERSIVTAIFNKMAVDVSQIEFRHVQLDNEGNYKDNRDSGLNECLNVEANIDQSGTAFKLDATISLLDEGCVALVPIDTTLNPHESNSYDINSIRVGKIIEWFPQSVRVRVYNDRTGQKEDVEVPKKMVAIVENPFYSIMNEPNSTLQRLIRKLNILDAIDEQSGAGKLDIIIQLPYSVKATARKDQAEERRRDIANQLSDSKYGIAYIDSTEHVTQLNRPVENNLLKQIEYLTSMLYSQLGISQSVMDGTADEQTMLNYTNRIVSVIATAFVDEMKRKFLTKTARSQGQSIMFFNDPFKLIPVTKIADMSDALSRNAIMTSNELRSKMGMKPSDAPIADELRNKNLNEEANPGDSQNGYQDGEEEYYDEE